MSAPRSVKFKGQVYHLAQQHDSVLKPADYRLCKYVVDHLGGSNSRMIHDCMEVVDQFMELGYSNPMDPTQQEAFFEETLESGWLTGQSPQRYEANVRPRFIKVKGQVYRLAAPALPPEYNIPVSAADLDPEVISWFHSSQGDPIYALGSRLHAYGETLASEDELSSLEYTLESWLASPEGHEEDPHTLDRIIDLHKAVVELNQRPAVTVGAAAAPAPNYIKVKGQVYRRV
jgi:hypothetical protein